MRVTLIDYTFRGAVLIMLGAIIVGIMHLDHVLSRIETTQANMFAGMCQ